MVLSTGMEDKTMGRNKKYGNIILKDDDREVLEKSLDPRLRNTVRYNAQKLSFIAQMECPTLR